MDLVTLTPKYVRYNNNGRDTLHHFDLFFNPSLFFHISAQAEVQEEQVFLVVALSVSYASPKEAHLTFKYGIFSQIKTFLFFQVWVGGWNLTFSF